MKFFAILVPVFLIELGLVFSPVFSGIFEHRDEYVFQDSLSDHSAYTFALPDFYTENQLLDEFVDEWYESLSPRQRIAELLMPAVGSNGISLSELEDLIQTDTIGGFMMLGSGVGSDDIARLQQQAQLYKDVPLLVSIDAEPSLVQYRLPELVGIEETVTYDEPEEIKDVAAQIALYIKDYGFSLNFAPVYDTNANQAIIGSRSFGATTQEASDRADIFSRISMVHDVIPTAKHFPGHGAVVGDSHLELPVIDNGLTELDSFVSAMDAGVPVIMVGHLAVEGGEYDTGGRPATLASIIQQDLLRNELDFEGVVITDAFNMAALAGFENKELESLKAGADIILMPQGDLTDLIDDILEYADSNPTFADQLHEKVKRVLRLKAVTPGL